MSPAALILIPPAVSILPRVTSPKSNPSAVTKMSPSIPSIELPSSMRILLAVSDISPSSPAEIIEGEMLSSTKVIWLEASSEISPAVV